MDFVVAPRILGLRHRLGDRIVPFLEEDEELRFVFMGVNLQPTVLHAGSTRIVAVTDRNIVLIVTGMLHRTTPYCVEERRPLAKLRRPDDVWPGTSLLGEAWGEALSGVWVHERYRPVVERARDFVEWLYP